MPICPSRLNPSSFHIQIASNEAIPFSIPLLAQSSISEIRVLGYCDGNAAPQTTKAHLRVECAHNPWRGKKRRGVFASAKGHEPAESTLKSELVSEESGLPGVDYFVDIDDGGSGDGNRGVPRDTGGGRGGGDGGEDEEGKEFGSVLKFGEVMRRCEKRGATLPSDMLEAAKATGIRELILDRYLNLQGSAWPLGFLMRHCSILRNRVLADPAFLFKVGTEVVIDSCCATFAEVQKRGEDFWKEFELYLADLLVGLVVNIALVMMLAPYARIGHQRVSRGFIGRVQQAYSSLPSSVFEAERPGCRFSMKQRIATYFCKGALYGLVGFGCGIIGQGIANLIMRAKRNVKKSDEDIPVPPLVKSAVLWGVFLGVSSNARYQVINGLEQLVEASPLAKRIPSVAMAFTVGVRLANNIYGGMQFVDWAKWSGVQ